MQHLEEADRRIPESENDRKKRRTATWTTVAAIPALVLAWLAMGWLQDMRTATATMVSTAAVCLLSDTARGQVATPIATCTERRIA